MKEGSIRHLRTLQSALHEHSLHTHSVALPQKPVDEVVGGRSLSSAGDLCSPDPLEPLVCVPHLSLLAP